MTSNLNFLLQSSRRIAKSQLRRTTTTALSLSTQTAAGRRFLIRQGYVTYYEQYPRCFSASASSSHNAFNTPVAIEDDDTDTDENESTKTLGKTVTLKQSSIGAEYFSLAKARLSALVVSTTLAGYVASSGGDSFSVASLPVLGSVLVGTMLCSSSAAGWNQIIEVNRDKLMKRTQQRPLVKKNGIMTLNHAKIVSTLWGASGIGLLALGTDPITTALGASNIILYAGLYTFMKPLSVYNTWVGAVVGAIPPVMGYTAAAAATASSGFDSSYCNILFDQNVAYLGSILFCWQMPHFFALSIMYRTDYKRGGFRMLPVVEYDHQQELERQQQEQGYPPIGNNPQPFPKTANVMLRYSKYMFLLPFLSTLSGQTNPMFAIEGIALNGYFYYVTKQFYNDRTNANARKVFLTSLWYLPSFLTLYLLHSKVWDKNDNENIYDDKLSSYVHAIRNSGKNLCIHETALVQSEMTNDGSDTGNANGKPGSNSKDTSAAALCPIVLAKRKSFEIDKGTKAVAKSVTCKAASAVEAVSKTVDISN